MLLGHRLDELDTSQSADALLTWANEQAHALQAGAPFFFAGERPRVDQVRGMLARLRCAIWWRRRLRRAVVLMREAMANKAGEVCATRGQVYVTHDTMRRRVQQNTRNAEMMAATKLENEFGDVFALAELAKASTANKAIRRGELMTRITGCEKLADMQKHPGVFVTATAPSRFHAVLRHGEKNPRHDGSLPSDAHAWLTATWAKTRAKLHHEGVKFYGFRVAEPHHDGCPHWHMLLWAPADQVERLQGLLRAWWLREDGDEAGAQTYRLQCKAMRPGEASGYVAKYIAKNIDDVGAVGEEGHSDDHLPDGPQSDLFGGTAQRVEAWAAAWGIRQFQAVGQPPVTVWRELRRVDAGQRSDCTWRLAQAFAAADRDGAKRADWAEYVFAQGGLGKGRDYLVRLVTQKEERWGRYEVKEVAKPVGVCDAGLPDQWHMSRRSEWRPRGAWQQGEQVKAPAKRAQPWTRVNNCTRPDEALRFDFRRLMGQTRTFHVTRDWYSLSPPSTQ